jgi:patatin-like phospholipase/acyl hydrolase
MYFLRMMTQQDCYQSKPLRILCLDGGGCRGLASLLILRQLLRRIEDTSKRRHKYYPHKYFDLICGTSTGGLIALMLGRCGMHVDEAIRMYKDVCSKVFSSDEEVFIRPIIRGQKFDTANFKKVLESWVGGKILNIEEEEENDDKHTGESSNHCRVSITSLDQDNFFNQPSKCFVTTVPSHRSTVAEPNLLRSYYPHPSVPELPPFDYSWLVTDAALAASATPSYFEPYSPVKGYAFKDAGAFGFNNPSEIAVKEAKRILAFSDRMIGCIVSIGSGMAPLSRRDDGRTAEQYSKSLVQNAFSKFKSLLNLPRDAYSCLNAIGNDLIDVATNTERTHYSMTEDFILGYFLAVFSFLAFLDSCLYQGNLFPLQPTQ